MKTKGLCFAVLTLILLFNGAVHCAHGQAGADKQLPPGAIQRIRVATDFLWHPAAQTAAFSPDGKLLATGGKDIRVWDVKARRLLRTIAADDGVIEQLRFSPDGKAILIRGTAVTNVSGFDVASGNRLFRFHPDVAPVNAFDVSPDGKILATAVGVNSKVVLWRTESKEELLTIAGHKYTLPPPQQPLQLGPLEKTVSVVSLAFSPDGKSLASRAIGDHWLRVFDVQTGKEMHAFNCPDSFYQQPHVVFSPEGYVAAFRPFVETDQTADPKKKPAIVLWDLKTGKVREEFDRPQWNQGHYRLAFSPDGKWMAGFRDKGLICVWDRATGKTRFSDPRTVTSYRWPTAGTPGGALAFSNDGDALVTSDFGSLELWDLKTGRSLLADGGHSGMVNRFELSSDGTTFVTGSTDDTVRLWDVKTGKLLRRLDGVGELIAYSPDGKKLALRAGNMEMVLWDIAAGKELNRFKLTASEEDMKRGVRPGYPDNAVFSIDGKTLIIASEYSLNYHFFDVETGKETRRFSWYFGGALSRSPASCRLSPDGKHFAGVYGKKDRDFVVALWDMTKPEPQILSDIGQHYYPIAFSADGEYLAWRDTKLVHIWDVRANHKLQSHKAPDGWQLAFSPDSRHLSVGKNLYPLNPKYPFLQLPIDPAYQAFSQDSRTLVALVEQDVLIFDLKKLEK